MDRLNYFLPYESKARSQEDQLTRAFLVVVRLVPLAQATFIDLVREIQEKNGSQHRIPPLSALSALCPSIQTQISSISQPSGTLVSIVMTDDHWTPKSPVEPSDRIPRYDGLICYPPDWILVIENKPSSVNIWEEQLHPNLPEESEILRDRMPVVLLWKTVIERLSSLIERDLLQGTEELVAGDFLEFVDENFPYLNPYTSLGICKDNEYLLQKRCREIMEQIAPGRVEHQRGYKDFIRVSAGPAQRVFLYAKIGEHREWAIVLEIHPGDTTNQARQFFNNVNRDEFLSLRHKGWSILPNLHFSFMATHLHWATPELLLEEYVEFWQRNKHRIKGEQRDSTGFQVLFSKLRSDGLISKGDVIELEKLFTQTKRVTVNICPGFSVRFQWTKAQASEFDREQRFTEAVQGRITEAMTTWGQTVAG